jgi:hypothetical protein
MYYNVLFTEPVSMPEPGPVALLAGAALIGWLTRHRLRRSSR